MHYEEEFERKNLELPSKLKRIRLLDFSCDLVYGIRKRLQVKKITNVDGDLGEEDHKIVEAAIALIYYRGGRF